MGQKTLCKPQCNMKRRQTIFMMSNVTYKVRQSKLEILKHVKIICRRITFLAFVFLTF